MKSFALALASLTLSAPVFAGAYVTANSEFNGTDNEYQSSKIQTRVGYDWKFDNVTPYIEAGLGRGASNGEDADGFGVLELGSGLQVTDNLGLNAKVEVERNEDVNSWKIAVGTKYSF